MNAEDDGRLEVELGRIASPLAADAVLRSMIEAFRKRETAIAKKELSENTVEQHLEDVERVADNLVYRSDVGDFERWDWAKQFLFDADFKNLYRSDRHWELEDFIESEIAEFLADPNWKTFAGTSMTTREQENLVAVLSCFEFPDRASEILELKQILSK